ncbi:MAG: hypothetical protein QF371_09505 [Flavobacteriales bacterium]|jgi:hypothetical protein|nr:hypothetical protein [Flavobacteriales bacterium]
MRKLTPEEYQNMNLTGRGRQSEFSRAVMQLEVGEILFLPKAEWKKKYHPGNSVYTISKRYHRKFEILRETNGKGWTVKRLK